jgi:exodeoxyribonuclease VII large subunit
MEGMRELPLGNVAEYTVTELSQSLRRTVEDAFGYVRLRGEISGFRGKHSSGHAYFALKDDRAKIDAVIWKTSFAGLKFKPEEGMEVIATGRVTTYPGKSSYQIIIEALEPAGIGALMALMEERKKKLAAEGLFDEARKRPLPFLPRVVGIVTSPTGAVIRDMLHGFEERFPACVLVWPVRVQGETSAFEVTAAIEGFNRLSRDGPVPRPDVLIVARGGGSLEDLWGFNEEILARAVAASSIPVISAVGHETDWTLIDFVADARAPTPTKAAEWAVPKHSELIARMTELRDRRMYALRRAIERNRSDLRAAARGLPRPQDLLGQARQRLDGASGRLAQALRSFAAEKRGRLQRWQGRLDVRLIAQRAERCGERVAALDREMRQVVRRLVQQRHVLLGRHAGRLQPALLRHPVRRARERLDLAHSRSVRCLIAGAEKRRRRVDALTQLLRSLSHRSVLERGFALVRDTEGRMIRLAQEAVAAGTVEVEFADGRLAAEIDPGDSARADTGKSGTKDGPGAPRQRIKKAKEKQGQLL